MEPSGDRTYHCDLRPFSALSAAFCSSEAAEPDAAGLGASIGAPGPFIDVRACACAAPTSAAPGAVTPSGSTCRLSSDSGWPLHEMLNALYQPKGDCLTSKSAGSAAFSLGRASMATAGDASELLRCAYGYS